MAQTVRESYAVYRLLRTPEGIEVQIKTSPQMEASFKAAAQGRSEGYQTIKVNGQAVSTHPWWYVNTVCGGAQLKDLDILWTLMAKGSSTGDGLKLVIPGVRTKQQLQDCARQAEAFLSAWYEQRMRPVDITVSVYATMAGPAATDIPQGAAS